MPAKFSLIGFTTLLCISCHICFAQQPKLILPVGHTGRVSEVRFSPYGKKIFSASAIKRLWETPVDNTVKIWESSTGKLLSDLHLFTGDLDEMKTQVLAISPDGSRIASVSKFIDPEENSGNPVVYTDTVKVWDAINNTLLFKFYSSSANLLSFSADSKLLAFDDGENFKVCNIINGKTLNTLKIIKHAANERYESELYVYHNHDENLASNIIGFLPDNSKIIVMSTDGLLWLMDILTGKTIARLAGIEISDFEKPAVMSPDGKKLITFSSLDFYKVDINGNVTGRPPQNAIHIIDAATGVVTGNIPMPGIGIEDFSRINLLPCFSPDSRSVIIHTDSSEVTLYDVNNGKKRFVLRGHKNRVLAYQFNNTGKKIVTASADHTAKVWDAASGKFLFETREKDELIFASFSPDDQKLLTMTAGYEVKTWDPASGKVLADIGTHPFTLDPVFSPDGKQIVTSSDEGIMQVWDAMNGKPVSVLKGYTTGFTATFDTANSQKVILTHGDTVKVWDIVSNKISEQPKEVRINPNPGPDEDTDPVQIDSVFFFEKYFSPDKKKFLVFANRKEAGMFYKSIITEVAVCKSDTGYIQELLKNRERDNLVTYILGYGGTDDLSKLAILKGHTDLVWSTCFSPDGKYILTASRDNTVKIWNANTYELLFTFFVVNDHDFLVVDKDSHYDGTEAARKLLYFTCGDEVISLDQLKDQLWVPDLAQRLMKGEKINAPKLSGLDICGLTPEVITMSDSDTGFRFKITARRGGLGETVLYINNIEAGRYKVNDLEKKGDHYELVIQRKEFTSYLKSGEENVFLLKAFTEKNTISSRGVILTNTAPENAKLAPDLYAVMVGVSDYKGDKIDLKYAAKDAQDLSAAIAAAARKMLNTDGKEHVIMYNLNTGTNRDVFPEKKSIKNIFDTISRKANANDILLIFFAGHGVMQGEQKSFYFLTADASGFGDVALTGISADELSEWIKPGNIKAQKRILIFDACNSGQVINDLVKIGGTGNGFVAARNDDKAEQVKAIDKLNEKSGLFILSASATDQSAYESGRYNQGILTYTLLKTIRDQPDILENEKYLNVSRWFNAAEKMVGDLAKENNFPQNPQLVSTTNFNMGIVDDSVRRGIRIEDKTPVFTSCNFQNNDESIADDDLQLNRMVNQELNELSKTIEHPVSFVLGSTASDVYALSGRYIVKRNELVLKINIKQGGVIKYHFELTGKKDNLPALAKKTAGEVVEWLKK